MDNDKFIQISVATMPSQPSYALVYALDEQGNVWKLVDGGIGGTAHKWTMLRATPNVTPHSFRHICMARTSGRRPLNERLEAYAGRA
jgi:hypothetical protein